MNKVTSYLKNISKSVAYASADVGLKLIPDVKDFVDTNEELFKSIYATVSHSKKSIAYGKKLAKESQLYKDIDKGIKNALEDIKSGNIYNKARSNAAIDAAGSSLAFGDDDFGDFNFDDFDDNFDDNFDDFDDESDKSSSSSISKGDIVVAETVSMSTNLSAQLISKTVANTSKAIIDTNIATTNMVMAQNVELMAGLRTSIMGMHQSINKALEFAVNVTKPQYDIQSEYFSKTQNLMTENNTILKEMLEMQRNMYKKQETSKPNDQFSNVFSGESIDLKEYFKAIGKNIKGLDKTGSFDMLTSSLGEQSMLSQIFTNPLGFVMTGLVSSMMPSSLAKSISSFNKTLAGVFPAMIAKLNRMKDRQDGSIFSYIGEIFGLSYDTKKTIDTSKYNKGAVPFDGITRKAIVDVIPEHLSRIESLLTGQSQRVYDFESGKWTDAVSLMKQFEDEYNSDIKGAFTEISDDFKNFINTLEKRQALSDETRRGVEKDMMALMKKVYEEDHHFSPENIKKNLWNYGIENQEIIEAFLDAIFHEKNKGRTSKFATIDRNIYEVKRRRGDRLRNIEDQGYSLERKLQDNSNLDNHLVIDDKYNLPKGINPNTVFGLFQGAQLTKNGKIEISKENLPKALRDAIDRDERDKTSHNENHYDPNVKLEDALIEAKHSVRQNFTDLDEDETKKYGKWIDKERKSHKIASEIEGETFFQKFSNATSWKAKKAVIYSSLDNIAKKPVEMINGLIYKADKSIYNLLFGEEYDPDMDDEKKSKDLKGLMGDIHDQLVSYMTLFTEKLDEKIISPMVKKFGLDEKWNNFKEKVGNTNIAQTLRNIKDNTIGALKSNMSGVKNYVGTSIKEVASPLINDPFIANFRIGLSNSKINGNIKEIDNLLNNITYEDAVKLMEYINSLPKQEQAAIPLAVIKKLSQIMPGLKKDYKYNNAVKLSNWVNRLSKERQNQIPLSASTEIAKTIQEGKSKDSNIETKSRGGIFNGPDGTKIVVANENEDIFVANNDYENISKNAKKELSIANKIKNLLGKNSSIGIRAEGGTTPEGNELGKIQKLISKTSKERIKAKGIEANKIDEENALSTVVKAGAQQFQSDIHNWASSVGISDENKEKINKTKENIITKASKIFGEIDGYDTIAKSLIGGGIGLFSGIIGGPLIGAAAGAGYSILKNSETVQNFLFGDVEKDDKGFITEQKGGKINKDIYNTFKKYIPDIGKYGVTGAVASLLLPFGPFAGAAIGAGIGLAKNSAIMSEMLFGDEEGLFNAKRKEKIKELLPKAAVGAAAGMVLGPFGLFGNAVLGSGIGLLTGTEEFKNLILGEPDQDGDRIGGLKGALEEHFVNPIKDFGLKFKDNFFEMLKVNMIDPLNEAISPIASEIAFQTKRLAFGLPKMLYNLIGDKMVKPLGRRLFDYTKPILGALGAPIIGAAKLGQKAIFSPFKAARTVSRGLRTHQIKQNRADYMTAQERLDWMKSRGYETYDTKAQDEVISKMDDRSVSDAASLLEGATGGLEYFDRKIRKNNKKLSKQIYDGYKGKYANKLKSLINKGKLSEATELLNTAKLSGDMSPEQFDTYRKEIIKLMTKNDELKKQKKGLNSYLSDDGTTVDPDKVIEKLNGIGLQVNNKEDLKALLKNMRTEARSRKKFDPNKIAESDLTPEGKAVTSLLKQILDAITGAKDSAEANDGKMVGATTKDINEHNTLLDNIDTIEEEQKEIRDKKITNKINTLTALGLDPSTFEGSSKKEAIKIISDDKKYKIVLKALKKGVKVKPEHLLNLGKYSDKQLRGLSRRPSLIVMSPKMINRYLSWNFLDTMGLSTIQNRNVLEKASEEGLDLSDNDAVADLMSNHRTTTFMERSIMGARKVKEQIKYHFTDKGAQRYIIDEKGNVNLDNADAGTKETTKALEEESKHRFSLANTLNSMKDGVLGLFNRQKDKDEKEEKEPFWKKILDSPITETVGKVMTVGGALWGVGKLKSMWDNEGPDGTMHKIAGKIGDTVGPVVDKVKNWFAGEGEYTGAGFPGWIENDFIPNLFGGIDFIIGTVLPKVAESIIKALPALGKSIISGIGSLLGFGNSHKDDNKGNVKDLTTKNGNKVAGVLSYSIGGSATQKAAEYFNNTTQTSEDIDFSEVSDEAKKIVQGINVPLSEEEKVDSSYIDTNTIINDNGAKVKQEINNSTPTQVEEDNSQVEWEGTPLYSKDSDGNLIPLTYKELQNTEYFYTAEGGEYRINPETGEFEGAGETTEDKSMLGAVGHAMGRSFIYDRKMPISLGSIGKGMQHIPGLKTFGKIVTPALKGIDNVINLGANLNKGIKNVAAEYAKGTTTTEMMVNKGIDVLNNVKESSVVKGIDNISSTTNKIIKWIKSGLNKIFNNRFVKNKVADTLKDSGKEVTEKSLSKYIDNLIESLAEKFSKNVLGEVGEKAAKQIAIKSSAALASGGLIPLGLAVLDFLKGFDQAQAVLGIEDVSFAQRLLAGLVNAANEFLLFGIIDTSTIVNWLSGPVLTIFGQDPTEFKRQQAEADRIVEEYNKKHGTSISKEEYFKNQTFTGKIGNFFSKAWQGTKNAFGSAGKFIGEKASDFGNWALNTGKNIKSGAKSLYDNTLGNITDDDKIRKRLGLNEDVKVTVQDRIASGTGSFLSIFTNKDAAEMTKIVNGAFETGKKAAKDAAKLLNDKMGSMFGFADDKGNSISMTEGVKNGIDDTVKNIKQSWSNAKQGAKDLYNSATNKFNEMKDEVIQGAKDLNKKIGATLGFTDDKGNPVSMTEGIKLGVDNAVNDLKTGWSNFKTSAKDTWDTINEKAGKAFKKLGENMDKGLKTLDKNVGSLLGLEDKNGNPISLSEGIKSTAKNVQKSLASGWAKFKKGTSNFFNGIGNWFDNVGDYFSKESDESVSKRNSGKGSGKEKFDNFISQLDPRYRNKKIGNENVASAGCAPATAANILNYYSGRGTMDNATKAASMYQSADGGVTPEYFENYLGSKGIGTYSTMNKNDIINGIASGRPTVLLGSDPTNKANTPYGASSSHYVLATGLDGRGNVIVQDPESRKPNVLYPMKDLINQSHLGMITGKGVNKFKSKLHSHLGKLGFGKGSQTIHQDLATFSDITASELNTFIKNYAGSNRGFSGKGELFIKASKASGLDPRYILAHAAEESGWGDSEYAKAGNFFGVRAYNSDPDQALTFSHSSMEEGLIEGAKWIRKNYYDQNQKTLYQMIHDKNGHNYAVYDNGKPNEDWMHNIASIMDDIGGNSNVTLHQPDDSITASGENTSNNLFSKITDAVFGTGQFADEGGYFDKNLMKLFNSNNNTSESSRNNSTLGSDLGSGVAREFHDKYLGNPVDVDGQYGAQCVDLFSQYKIDHVDGKRSKGNAKDLYNNHGDTPGFRKVPLSQGQYGDWVIWGGGPETDPTYGHVGMFMKHENGRILTFGQNQGPGSNLTTGKAGSEDYITDQGVLGLLRPTSINGKGTGKHKIQQYLTTKPLKKMRKIPGVPVNSPYLKSDPRLFLSESDVNMISGKGTQMPSLTNATTYTNTQNSAMIGNISSDSKIERLISVVIEVLKIIADNTSKLSEIVTLLSKSLDINLTDQEISKLSSNNAQIKNKIANALKSQGSPNGIGSSVMNANTQSLADALYSIARA